MSRNGLPNPEYNKVDWPKGISVAAKTKSWLDVNGNTIVQDENGKVHWFGSTAFDRGLAAQFEANITGRPVMVRQPAPPSTPPPSPVPTSDHGATATVAAGEPIRLPGTI